MEVRKSIKTRNYLSLKRYINSSIADYKENDDQNDSSKSKITQSDSTTIEEKKDFSSAKKSFLNKPAQFLISDFIGKVASLRKRGKSLILTKLKYKSIYQKYLEYIKIKKYNYQKRNQSTKNRKTNMKILFFAKNKDIKQKKIINNNKEQKTNTNIFIKNNDFNFGGFNENYKSILKPSAPKRCKLHKYKVDLSKKNINNNYNVYRQKIPHVFLNHLLFNNRTNYNINKDKYNYQISITERIKSKNLTILYYRPLLKI